MFQCLTSREEKLDLLSQQLCKNWCIQDKFPSGDWFAKMSIYSLSFIDCLRKINVNYLSSCFCFKAVCSKETLFSEGIKKETTTILIRAIYKIHAKIRVNFMFCLWLLLTLIHKLLSILLVLHLLHHVWVLDFKPPQMWQWKLILQS